MILKGGSHLATHKSFYDISKSVQECHRLSNSRGRIVPFARLPEGKSGGLHEMKGVVGKLKTGM
jgi:hypothetical protein